MWFPNTERIHYWFLVWFSCVCGEQIPVIVDPRRCHGPLKCVVCASGHKEPSMLHSAVDGEVLHEGHVDSLCQQCSCPLCPGSNCFVSFRENCIQNSNHNCEFIYWFLFSSVSFASQTYFPDHWMLLRITMSSEWMIWRVCHFWLLVSLFYMNIDIPFNQELFFRPHF